MASRKAIVTASDSGIGKATAVRLARDGFDVGVTWHSDRHGAEGTAREVDGHGGRAVMAHLDVTRFEEAADTVEALATELGGLDVFVNNAGGGPHHSFLDFPLEDWRQVIDLNLTGAFACAQRAARLMVDAGRGGRIVNVTSVHEHVPLKGAAAYCAGKGGLGLLTKVMALELGEHGIAVNAVAPGEIATPMTGAEDRDPATEGRAALPAGRPGNAHEIAEAIAFLANPDSRYVTGASIVVDGGLMLTAAEFNREAAS
jgi:NAD(P)-dependent dehydrogenase (short-subunit alcohol dehydrogenase family)